VTARLCAHSQKASLRRAVGGSFTEYHRYLALERRRKQKRIEPYIHERREREERELRESTFTPEVHPVPPFVEEILEDLAPAKEAFSCLSTAPPGKGERRPSAQSMCARALRRFGEDTPRFRFDL
jgi:hypothetical protein